MFGSVVNFIIFIQMVVLDSNFGMLSNTNNENHYIIPDPVTLPPTVSVIFIIFYIKL